MFCEQCGAELEPDARFCSTCGKQLEDEGAPFSVQHVLQTIPTWRLRLLSRKRLIAGSLVGLVLSGAVLWMAGPEKLDLPNLASDPKEANEANVGKAIAEYLRNRPAWYSTYKYSSRYGGLSYWYCLGNDRYPSVGEQDAEGLGFVKEVGRVPLAQIYDLTDKGRSIFTPGKGFCYGEPKLLRVVNFTAPTPFGSYTMSNVVYEYQIINIPDWARQPDAAKLEKISQALSSETTPLRDDATLILTNKGWVHQKLFK
ncbi:MAG: zinc-ribbon domain-containing protein [Gammaproteobacteria bacterium]